MTTRTRTPAEVEAGARALGLEIFPNLVFDTVPESTQASFRRWTTACLTAAADAAAAPDDETTLAFPVRAEDRVTGPEMLGVAGDGPAFFLSGDDEDAPAVGVTVDAGEIDRLAKASWDAVDGYVSGVPWDAVRSTFRGEKERRRVRALLTAQPEPGTKTESPYKVNDRVCTEHGNCGFVQHLYDDGAALIQFDEPGWCRDTWLLSDLYPEFDDEVDDSSDAERAATEGA